VIVGIIWRKPVLTHASITCEGMLASVNSVVKCLRPNSITLSRSQTWSQTWYPTCRRQVRAISTCRDSSNLVADRCRPYSIALSCSLAGVRPASKLVADLLGSWTACGNLAITGQLADAPTNSRIAVLLIIEIHEIQHKSAKSTKIANYTV